MPGLVLWVGVLHRLGRVALGLGADLRSNARVTVPEGCCLWNLSQLLLWRKGGSDRGGQGVLTGSGKGLVGCVGGPGAGPRGQHPALLVGNLVS